jgi:superfamily II DNA or RNA helicase
MLQDVQYPAHKEYRTGSPHEPLEFYMNMLLNSTHVDFLLGYFSSSAINLLALGFAKFISSGGTMRIIINNVLSPKDKAALQRGIETDEKDYKFSVEKYEMISQSLNSYGVHFFECLSWLIAAKRIEIVAIKPKNKKGISHFKSGIFSDGKNKVKFKGSVNFTAYGLAENLEELGVHLSWNEQTAVFEEYESYFNNIFTNQFEQTEIIDFSEIETRITEDFGNKDLEELLVDEEELIKSKKRLVEQTSIKQIMHKAEESITEYLTQPKFPFNSEPRDYQKEAYENWVKNDRQGIFAMATGTGKTITALNCLLNEYNESGVYRAIITVPTIELLKQWKKECKKFNFKQIVTVSSKEKWLESISLLNSLNQFTESSFIIIVTYASFRRKKFQLLFKQISTETLLIADEAHNLGSGSILKILPKIHLTRRIGLSATPERKYDIEGNKAISTFFNEAEEYTFSYTMEMAMNSNPPSLCKYLYYPHIVYLNDYEMEEYIKITKILYKYIDPFTKRYKDCDEVKMKLLERKRIIHKAGNKKTVLEKILKDEFKKRGNLKYTLIYVPEGKEECFETSDVFVDDEDDIKLISEYTKIVRNTDESIMVNQYTSKTNNREQLITEYEKGEVHALTSMKCLDEGVDIPRSELAIFCASTGNPRQFIQRRGRILRLHKDKKNAVIHDLVVTPKGDFSGSNFEVERSFFKGELERVKDFSKLSENQVETYTKLKEILNFYNLNLFD